MEKSGRTSWSFGRCVAFRSPGLVQERGDDEVADPALDDLLVDVGLVPERGEVLDDERAPQVHRALVDGPLELLLRVVPGVGEDARVLALGAVVQDEDLVAAQRGEAEAQLRAAEERPELLLEREEARVRDDRLLVDQVPLE